LVETKVKVLLTFLAVVLVISLLATGVFRVFPAITAQIAMQPDRVENIFPNGNFTIDLTVADAEDTQQWDANITFNPNVLKVVDAAEGPFLKQGAPTFFGWKAPEGEGWMYIASTYYIPANPGDGVNGNGILANITFEVTGRSHTPIHFREELTRLFYNNGTDFARQPRTLHDSYFTNLHDIAITSVTVSPTQVNLGDQVSINVTIVNQGDFTDTFDLAAFQNLIPFSELTNIGTKPDIALEAGAQTSQTFTWGTTSERSGNYNITTDVPPLPTEADTANNKRTASDTVTILGAPVAYFTHTPEKPTIIDTVIFDASKSYDPDDPVAGIVSHRWDFGDGTIEIYEKGVNLTDPVTHNYTSIGNYDVNVTVTDIESLTDTYTKTLTVSVPKPPIANFTCTTDERLINRPVAFDASESYDPDGSIVSYEWDFGDGSDPEFYEDPDGVNVTHIYTDAGTYTVNLTVTDNHDASASTTREVTVSTKRDLVVDRVTCYRKRIGTEPRKKILEAYIGETLNISVIVRNEGTQYETFNLTVNYDGPSTGTFSQEVDNLPPGDQTPDNRKIVGIWWGTTPVSAGNYTITVEAVLDQDQNQTNNKATTEIKMNIAPDIAITNVTVSPTTVLADDLLNITVSIKNEGTYDVSCSVFVYFSNDTHSNISPTGLSDPFVALNPDDEEVLYFNNWNLTKYQLAQARLNLSVMSPGNYTISAEAKLGATERPYEFDVDDNLYTFGNVTIGASLISIFASETTTTVGSKTTINGSITPTRHGANVTIWYKLSDEENWDILNETLTTNENSTYIYLWTPQNTGTYHLKASWIGDNMTLPDESDVLEINVRERPPDILLYAAVGAAAIVAAAAAIYFLKIRKAGKPT